MDACINHEDHAAIEHCEICGDALCDLCLWYDTDGRRLCERHAREYEEIGGSVQSPGVYAEGIQLQEAEDSPPRAPYEGNQTDLTALVAVILGATSLLSLFGGGLCIPLGAGVLGLVALTSKQRGLDPGRVQKMGIFGVGLGMLGLVPIVLFFCIFAFTFGLALSGNAGP